MGSMVSPHSNGTSNDRLRSLRANGQNVNICPGDPLLDLDSRFHGTFIEMIHPECRGIMEFYPSGVFVDGDKGFGFGYLFDTDE